MKFGYQSAGSLQLEAQKLISGILYHHKPNKNPHIIEDYTNKLFIPFPGN
jgi:hypothetical protein